MNIIKTTLIKTAREQTPTARYDLEYTVTDTTLERVVATLFEVTDTQDPAAGDNFMGTITYEHGNIYCNLPCRVGEVSSLVARFEEYLTQIRAELSGQEPAPSAQN